MTGLRRILPRPGWVALMALLYLGVWGLQAWLTGSVAFRIAAENGMSPGAAMELWSRVFVDPELDDVFGRMRALMLFVFAGGLGFYRSSWFHPASRSDYREWLLATPWRHPRPLPFGPVALTPWDALVVLALAGLVALDGVFPMGHVPLLFGVAYMVPLLSLLSTSAPRESYALMVGLGAVGWVLPDVWLALAILAGLVVIAHRGIGRSLAGLRDLAGQAPAKRSQHPFVKLSPHAGGELPPTRVAVALAAIAGWITFVAVDRALLGFGPEVFEVTWLFDVFVLVVAASRVLPYIAHYASPIGVWGRIRTGRWIVPGYDVVFVAPLILVGVGQLLPGAFAGLGLPLAVNAALSVAGILLLAQLLPPSPRRFALTGRHRIRVREDRPAGLDLNAEVSLGKILNRQI